MEKQFEISVTERPDEAPEGSYQSSDGGGAGRPYEVVAEEPRERAYQSQPPSPPRPE